jgi:hypothetical protein
MSARPIESFNLRERIDIAPAAVVKATKAPAVPAALPAKLKVHVPFANQVAVPKPAALPFIAANNQFKFQLAAAKAVQQQPNSPPSDSPTPAPRIESSTINAANLRLSAQLEDVKIRHQKAVNLVESKTANLRQTATLLITERKEHQASIARLQAELDTAAEVEARLRTQLSERPSKPAFNDAEFAQKVASAVEDENAVTSRTAEITELNVQLTTLSDKKVLIAAEISALELLRDAASSKLEELRAEHRVQRSITDKCADEHKALVAQKAGLTKDLAALRAEGANVTKINEDKTLLAINEQVAQARAELLRMDEEKVKRSRRVVAAEDVWEAAGHVAEITEEVEEAPPLTPVEVKAPQTFDDAFDPPVEAVVSAAPAVPDESTEAAATSALEEPVEASMKAPVDTLGGEVLAPTALPVVPEAAATPSEDLVMITEADLVNLEMEVTAVEAEVALEGLETLLPKMPPLPPPMLPLTSNETNMAATEAKAPITFTPIPRPKSIHARLPKVASRSGIAVHLPQVQHTMRGVNEFGGAYPRHLRKSRTPFHASPVRVPFWWELRRFALLVEREATMSPTTAL